SDCWSRPIARTSRPSRTGASVTNRRSWQILHGGSLKYAVSCPKPPHRSHHPTFRSYSCGKLVNSMNFGKLGQALTAKEIFDLIQGDLEQVEKRISVESVASVDAVTAIGQYLQSAGGKRLRPSLLLISSKLIGHGTSATALQLGAVVELIHAATLV